MSVIPWLVVVFFGVIATAPLGVEWREKRRARRQALLDQVTARVTYLPSACCQPKTKTPPSDELASGVSEADEVGEVPLPVITLQGGGRFHE